MNRATKSALWTGSAVGVVVFGGWALLSTSDIGRSARTLQEELAVAKAAGIPLEPDDLRKGPSLRTKDNPISLYHAVMPLLHKLGWNSPIYAVLFPAPTARQWAESKKGLSRQAKVLKFADAITSKPRIDFMRVWERGPSLLMPEYADMKALNKVLCSAAAVDDHDGDPDGALHRLSQALLVGRHAGQDPTIMGCLIQEDCEATCFATLDRIVKHNWERPGFLAKARECADSAGAPPSLRFGMRSELVENRIVLKILARSSLFDKSDSLGSDFPLQLKNPLYRTEIALKAFESRAVELGIETDQILSQPDPLKVYRDLDASQKRLEAETRPSYMVCQWLAPVFNMQGGILNALSRRNLQEAEIDIFEAKLRSGAFPAVLPKPQLDAFTNRSLQYKRSGEGFVVWSVGRDFADNDGQGKQSGAMKDLDTVIAYPEHRMTGTAIAAPSK